MSTSKLQAFLNYLNNYLHVYRLNFNYSQFDNVELKFLVNGTPDYTIINCCFNEPIVELGHFWYNGTSLRKCTSNTPQAELGFNKTYMVCYRYEDAFQSTVVSLNPEIEISGVVTTTPVPSNNTLFYVRKNGDSMGGPLFLYRTPIEPNEATPKSYVDVELSKLKSRTEVSEANIDNLLNALDSIDPDSTKLDLFISRLSNLEISNVSMGNIIGSLSNGIDNLSTEFSLLSTDFNTLESSVANSVSTLTETNDSILDSIESLTNTKNSIVSSITELFDKVQDNISEIDSLKNDKQALTELLTELSSTVSTNSFDIEELKNNQHIIDSIADLVSRVDSNSNSIEELTTVSGEFSNLLSELTSSVSEINSEIENINNDKLNLSEILSEALDRVENNTNAVAELRDNRDQFLTKFSEFDDFKFATNAFLDSINERLEPLDDFIENVDTLKAEVNSLDPRIANLEQEFQNHIEAQDTTISDLSIRINEVEESIPRIENLENRVDEITETFSSQIEDINNQIEILNSPESISKIEEIESRLDSYIEFNDGKISDLESNISTIENNILNLENSINELNNGPDYENRLLLLEEYKQENEDFHTNIFGNITNLLSQFEEHELRIENLESLAGSGSSNPSNSDIEELRSSIVNITDNIDSLSQGIDSVNQSLLDHGFIIQDVTGLVRSLGETVDEVAISVAQVGHLPSEFENLQLSLTDINSRCLSLEEAFSELSISLPVASRDTFGCIFVGRGLDITEDGLLSLDSQIGYAFTSNSESSPVEFNGSPYASIQDNYASVLFEIQVIGTTSDGTKSFAMSLEGLVRIIENNIEIIGSFLKTRLSQSPDINWDVSIDLDSVNKGLIVNVRGDNSSTIEWTAQVGRKLVGNFS